MVPSMPMCIAVISPTLTATRMMPAKVQRSWRSAMSGSLRPRRSSASTTTTSNRPEAAGAAHPCVGVGVDRGPAALRDVAGADLDLVGDRGGALVLAAEPRID